VAKVLAVLALGAAGIIMSITPANAAGTDPHGQGRPTRDHSATTTPPSTVNWSQHDTAVYVVSTLNLLHTRSGRSFPDLVTHKFDVTRYDVYADQSVSNLYYVQLRQDDGTVVGAFAYSMGWPKPRILFLGVDKPQASHAPQRIALAYHSDPKTLIGSFTSTLPS
jgi:hypothetical protein